MKNGKLKRFTHRALSMLLAVLTVLPSGLLTMPARAAEIQTTQTKIVVWDWITDMQSIGKGADYDPNTDPFVDGHAAIPVGDTKYTRIMFYQSTGGDRYYFNGGPEGGNKPGYYSNYDENKIYLDSDSRIGNSSHKEWNQDLTDFEHFVTLGGQRTPYIQYAEEKEGYHSWRFWCANKDDSLSDYTLMLVDDYEDLDLRRTYGGFSDPHIYYGAKNNRFRSDGWIIDKHFVGAAAANYKYTHDNFVIWHWDNDSGGYNETLDFDVGDRKFKSFNAGTKAGVEEFKIYLGKEYSVGTLAENYTVPSDQSQTLGRPLYYIPKGKVITVAKDAVLTIDGVLLNDGEIVVKDGGLLVVKDGAKIMPLTKYDNNCGMITSQGNIVVGDDALLCGGGVNGIRILGGGVVNFGVMAAESFYVSENYAIDNRETGWVLAGKSPSRESRIRYITDAIANEGATKPTDVNKDFAKIANFDSSYNIPVNGIYGNTANVSKSGEKAVGSASDPTLSVYTRDTPNDAYEKVFEDVKLDKVDVRVEGDKVTYTAEGETYTIQKKLVAAAIGRGGKEKETVFQDMWAGGLDGAYVQFEPAGSPGKRLALTSGSATQGNSVIVWEANNDKDKWWQLVRNGKSGVTPTYYINSVKNTSTTLGLDISGVNSVSDGSRVLVASHSDGGNDQRWLIVPAPSGDYYFFRNAANTGVSLSISPAINAGNGTAVSVTKNNPDSYSQRWRIANLLTEDRYDSAVSMGTALEFIPQSNSAQRLSLNSSNGAYVADAVAGGTRQRWRLEAVGTDLVDGATKIFYRIVETETGRALSVQGSTLTNGTGVTTAVPSSQNSGIMQFWYLEEAGGMDEYAIVLRSNTAYVLSVSGADVRMRTNAKESTQRWKASGLTNVMEEARKAADAEDPNNPLSGTVIELEPVLSDVADTRVTYDRSATGDWIRITANASGTDTARWQFKKAGSDENGDYYQLLSLDDAGSAASANFVNTASTQGELRKEVADASDIRQHYYLTAHDDGTYTIRCRGNVQFTVGALKMTDLDTNAVSWAPAYMKGAYSTTLNRQSLKKDFYLCDWRLSRPVKDPLDGQTFTIESVGQEGRFIIPYGYKASAQGSYAEVYQAADQLSYGRWTFKQIGTEDGKPYFIIYSAHDGQMLDRDTNATYVYTTGDYATGTVGNRYYWFVQTNDDGTYTFLPKTDSKKAAEVFADGSVYRMRASALGSNPTNNQKWKLAAPTVTNFIDGRVFYLSPKHTGSDMVLDLVGNGTANETKVQIYEKKETEIQRWKFEKVGTDYLSGKKCNYYTIKSVYATGKALDNSGSTANGARPHLWDYSASNKNQQWYVTDAGGGYYYIIPRSDTTKYLGVQSANTGNNSVVELWDSNGDNRKWKLTETIAPETLGTYSLLPKHAPGMHVGPASSNSDNGTKLIIWEYNESSNYARWTFVKMGTDSGGAYYKIVNMANGKVIDATGINTIQADSQLQQWDSDFNNDQLWYLNDAGQDENGLQYYNIVNRCDTNYCMAVSGGSTTHGTGVTVSKKNGGDSQKFRLMERFEPVELGTYEFGLNDSAYSYLRMVVQSGSADNGNSIVVYCRHTSNPNAGAKLVQFKIIQRGTDIVDGVSTPYYSIQNTSSGKVLDPIGAASVSDGTNVQQYSYDGYSDQHWYMEVRGDNSVVFRNRCNSNLVLTAEGTNDSSNIALKTYDEKNLSRQSWQLHPIMQTNAAGQYYIPGNKAAADAGIPFMSAEDTLLNPEVGGKYNLIPQHATGLRMDLYNNDTSNGKIIWAYTNNGGGAQKWQFIPMGVDYFDGGGKIFYKLAFGSNANKVAQSAGISTVKASQDISIYDDEGCYDDQWYLEQAGERTEDGETFYNYYIVGRGTMSSASKICIAVPGGATGSGTQLQTATVRSGSSYKYLRWELLPTD